ncbi:hypothetical protein HSX11_04625 [Oxalobacteraceae bacterium]|nr:hypothetical protein [Oxalobacteraceae bacterium]
MATASTANAAARIGSAAGAYSGGDKAVFAVPTASDTVLYLFTSDGDDATVSAGELAELAVLTGTSATSLADYGL